MSLETSPAPNFNLPGSDGKTHALSDYSGKRIILFFYPKDNTPGCTKEACAFRDFESELKKLGYIVFGVSRDSLKSHDKFIADHDLNFVLLSDEDTEVMQAYGAWGEKMMYGKTVVGCIRSTVVIGEDGSVIKHWPKVSRAADHPAKVIEGLQELG